MIKNLLKIVLASLMLTSATGTAKAVTVDDLVQYGGDAIEIFLATMCNALSWIAQMA